MAPLIIAHRGDSSRFPENTLAAFRGALEAGADLVELDVQLSKDGEVVVLHDGTLDRTTGERGSVRQKTLAEIRSLSAHLPSHFGERFRGERVPTLGEALALLKGRARVMVELKKESVEEDGALENGTIDAIRRESMADEVVIISFVPAALRRCREKGGEIARGHLFSRGNVEEIVTGALDASCQFILPEKTLLSSDLSEKARRAGLKVATWVVDDPEELRTLAPYDLFGVASNCPQKLLEAIWDSE